MANEYKSFFKTVGGNEGTKCYYPTRLDTYGCGCSHDRSYCYAKSLLSFRGLWHPTEPAEADIDKIRKKIQKLPDDMPAVRLGGMTDCLMPVEKERHVTYDTIEALNEKGQSYLIVTKSALIADDEYMAVMDADLAHIQVTVTTFDDEKYLDMGYEKASLPSKRIEAIEKLQDAGFDVQLRLSPYVEELVDPDKLSSVKCDKLLVEFLRVNSWIAKWFGKYIDMTAYSVKQNGYSHLPLERKVDLISGIHGFREISVCEDESEAYEYWKTEFNPNPEDCCNLRKRGISDGVEL